MCSTMHLLLRSRRSRGQRAGKHLPLRAGAYGVILLLLGLTWRGAAQQIPPLQGQGVDPLLNGVVTHAVPVFMSVELQKLLVLDENNYQFQAQLDFQQSWIDPRSTSQFAFIDFKDQSEAVRKTVFKCATGQELYPSFGAWPDTANANFTKYGCGKASWQPPPCSKYCKTVGAATDNPWRCCDLIWLPDIKLRNLIDSPQDRVVYDAIWPFNNSGVHRQTRVLARFSTPLQFKKYPFDRQRLQVILEPNINTLFELWGASLNDPRNQNNNDNISYLSGPYFIVPSAVFRRLNQDLVALPNGTGQVTGSSKDELAGWNIESVSFTCANASASVQRNGNGEYVSPDAAAVSSQTQDYAPEDEFSNYYGSVFAVERSPALLSVQTCGLTISVVRLSNTAVVQSIVPVSFTGLLAFVVFLSAPDALDVRIGTDVTLFLALTALQFVFESALPLTSYLTDFDNFILLSYCLIMVIVLENVAVAYICTRPVHWQRIGKVRDAEREAMLSDGSFVAPGHENKGNGSLHEGPNGESAGAGVTVASTREILDAENEESAGSDSENKKERANRKRRWGLASFCSIWSCAPSSGAGRLQASVQQMKQSWSDDPQKAYRLAVTIDRVSAVALFFAYALLGVLNFTVGFV